MLYCLSRQKHCSFRKTKAMRELKAKVFLVFRTFQSKVPAVGLHKCALTRPDAVFPEGIIFNCREGHPPSHCDSESD